MCPSVYLLDTCVWRDAVRARAWLRAVAADGAVSLAISGEAVRELAVAALTATTTGQFEEVRAACALATRYADAPCPPIEWHVAQAVGMSFTSAPDPRHVCEFVARFRTQDELRSNARDPLLVGGGRHVTIDEWPAAMHDEKSWMRDGMRGALEAAEPGIMGARARGAPVRIDSETYEQRGPDLRSRLADALTRTELRRMTSTLDADTVAEVDVNASTVFAPARDALWPYASILAEVFLDRYDGAHNANDPKVAIEPNDWYDVAQFRYLQPGWTWVTSDRLWRPIARRAGVGSRVVAPGHTSP